MEHNYYESIIASTPLEAYERLASIDAELREIQLIYGPSAWGYHKFNPSTWPLKVVLQKGPEEIVVPIWGAKAGFRSDGAEFLMGLLDLLGAEYHPEDILKKKHMGKDGNIRLFWKKQPDGCLVQNN